MKETSSVVEDAEPTLCIEIADQAFLESCDGDGPVVPASKFESGILTVEVLVKSNPLSSVAVVAGDLGGKVGVAKEGYQLAFCSQFRPACLLLREW